MAASTATYVGNIKGILGLSDNAVTGLVIDDISFDYKSTEHPYMDINGDVTSVAYTGHQIDGTITGRILNGTSFSANICDTLTLNTIPAYLPSGYDTGGANIITNIKQDEKVGEYQTISITFIHYPKVTAA